MILRRGRRHTSRAQAMVEFALVAPIFFFLLFGVIEAGRFVFYYEMLNSATREGARYAIVHGYNAGVNGDCDSGPRPPAATNPSCDLSGARVKEAVRKAAHGLVGIGAFETLSVYWCPTGDLVACTATPGDNGRGSVVTVKAVYRYPPILPVLPKIGIESESTLVINN
jgi:hypothetical protein